MGRIRWLVSKVWDLIGGDALWHLITEFKRHYLGRVGVSHVLTFIGSLLGGIYGALQASIHSKPTYIVVTFFVLLFAGVLGIINLLWALWDKWQQRQETTNFKSKTKDKTLLTSVPSKAPRLQFEFPESDLDHSNPNVLVVFVRVRNLTLLTIPDVEVRILSIIKITEPEHSDIARHLEALDGLPLMLHGDPDRPPRRAVDLHAEDSAKFDVVTLQQPSPEILLHHAIWQETPIKGYWIQHPASALYPGHYRIQLKAQGYDTPPEILTIEFTNLPNQRRIKLKETTKDPEQKQVQEPVRKEQATPTLNAQHQLVATLKRYAEGPANVHIRFAEIKQRPLADTLVAVFELAGWETNFANVPFDSYVSHRPYVQGTEVLGYNKHLVEAVTTALKNANLPDLPEVRTSVNAPEIKRESPKWNYIQHYIRITIEHHE